MPISAVTFIMSERQWFKAEIGLDGGRVGVDSKPGQGASFWLDLQAA